MNLDLYVLKHSDALSSVSDFKQKLKGQKDWQSGGDIVNYFGSSKVRTIGNNRLRFEIGGNNHRMIVKFAITQKKIWFWLMWIGTKEESNKVDLKTVDVFK